MPIKRPTLLTLLGFLLGVYVCQLASAADRVSQPCGANQDLLIDKAGEPVWLGFDELKRHAINMASAKSPSSFRTTATISVNVLVATDGRVSCVSVPLGHPLLRLAAADAAKSWTFQPFIAGGMRWRWLAV